MKSTKSQPTSLHRHPRILSILAKALGETTTDSVISNRVSGAAKESMGKYGKVLLDLIKDQMNLDLTSLVHDKQPKPRTYLGVNLRWDCFETSMEVRQLQALETKGYFSIQPNGGLGIALVFGPKLLELAKRAK